jgi:transketolase
MSKIIDIKKLDDLSLDIRKRIISAAYNAKGQGVHLGGALSIVEILVALYGHIMNFNPEAPSDENRDRFILSKGHACLGLYATLNAIGCITNEELKDNYLKDGGFLQTHPEKNVDKGIECSSGSLGMGLSFAVGKALAAKLEDKQYKVFVVVGDGECNEGSIWEAMMAAKQYKLDNLFVFIDKNHLQSDGATKDIMDLDLLVCINAFGFETLEINGHSVGDIIDAVDRLSIQHSGKPKAIIANTVKGKGVSFMENNNQWHHNYLSDELYSLAMRDLIL